MTDDVDKRQDEAASDEADGPVGGERLAAARRELQISVLEIAKELHLDEPKVRALERNEFDVLGAPVFAKGHLKKYSQLVNVNSDDVIADYYQMNRAATMPPLVAGRPRPRQELSPGPWIVAVVVVIIAATAYWWFTRVPATPTVDLSNPPEIAIPGDVSDDTVLLPADDEASADEPEPEPEPVEEAPAIEPEPVVIEETSSPAIDAGQMRILLTYTGDCWTEISDANGRRLFFDLGKDGRTVELSGAEPFNVLFGNPGNVSVMVNGDGYELPPTAPNRPLRTTISGS